MHKMVNKHQSRSFKIKKEKLKYLLICHDGPIYNEKLFDVRNDVRQWNFGTYLCRAVQSNGALYNFSWRPFENLLLLAF